MNLHLHIERLVLDQALLGGKRASDVQATIERELAQWLAQPCAIDALRVIGAVDRLPPASLPAAKHPRDSLGARIATAAGDSLGVPSAGVFLTHSRTTPGAQSCPSA